MLTERIELRKIRDFSENLNDTFLFIRQEIKPLLASFFAIAGIFILLAGIFGASFQGDYYTTLLRSIRSGTIGANDSVDIISANYFLLIFFSILSNTVIRVMMAAYFKLYDINGTASPTIEALWKEVLKYIVPIFFYSILLSIIIGIGLVLCLVPGIYYLVFFAPINFIFVIENAGLGEAWSRCGRLLKENFWNSFGLYIVSYLIYAVSSSVIGVVTSALAGLVAYFTTKDVSSTIKTVTGILTIFQQLFLLIFYVSIGLHYYNLAELADGEGLMRKLDSIGNNNVESATEEQY